MHLVLRVTASRLEARNNIPDAETLAVHTVSESPFRFLGADDTTGPNYTGQPVVNSYYE